MATLFLSWPWRVNELVFVLYAAVAICMCLSAYTCVYVLVCVCEHIWVCTCMCWFLCICMRVRQMRSDQFTEVHKFHLFSSDWFCHGLFSSLYSCLLFLFSLWVFQCMPTSQKHITYRFSILLNIHVYMQSTIHWYYISIFQPWCCSFPPRLWIIAPLVRGMSYRMQCKWNALLAIEFIIWNASASTWMTKAIFKQIKTHGIVSAV